MERLFTENAKEKSDMLNGLLANAQTREEAQKTMKDHLRFLSASCDASLKHIDTSLIMIPGKSLNEIFLHYLTCTEKKAPVTNLPNAKRVYKKETSEDKQYRKMVFEKLQGLNLSKKLKDFEDRVMKMVDQHYSIKQAQTEADEKKTRVNMRLWSRQLDRRVYYRSLDRTIARVNRLAEECFPDDEEQLDQFRQLIVQSVAEHCRRERQNRGVVPNDFEEDPNEVEIEPIDIELPQDILHFLKDMDRILSEIAFEKQDKNISPKYHNAVRALLIHIVSQASQYWDAAIAMNQLAEKKAKLESDRNLISVKIERCYEAKRQIKNVIAAWTFLRRLSNQIASRRQSSNQATG